MSLGFRQSLVLAQAHEFRRFRLQKGSRDFDSEASGVPVLLPRVFHACRLDVVKGRAGWRPKVAMVQEDFRIGYAVFGGAVETLRSPRYMRTLIR